jgi:GxxExxY protein
MAFTRTLPINKLKEIVIGLCIKVHNNTGPGCFERVYEEILYYELTKAGIEAKREVLLPIDYEELHIKDAYKLDLLIENKLIAELKSIYPLPPVFFNQIHTYLSLTNLKHGVLLNFKVPKMKEGIHRVFNNFGKEEL